MLALGLLAPCRVRSAKEGLPDFLVLFLLAPTLAPDSGRCIFGIVVGKHGPSAGHNTYKPHRCSHQDPPRETREWSIAPMTTAGKARDCFLLEQVSLRNIITGGGVRKRGNPRCTQENKTTCLPNAF